MESEYIELTDDPESSSPIRGRIEKSFLRYQKEGKAELTISGWLLYLNTPIVALQFGLPGSNLALARKIERPEVGMKYPKVEGSNESGFRVVISLNDRSGALDEVYFVAILANGLTIAGALTIPETVIQDPTQKKQETLVSQSETDPAVALRELQLAINKKESEVLKELVAAKKIGSPLSKSESSQQKNNTEQSLLERAQESKQDYEIIKENYRTLSYARLTSFLSSNEIITFPKLENPKTSVLLVLHNKAEYTLDCIRSLKMSSTDDFEVVIVDNSSTDSTSKMLKKVKGITLIQNSDNKHFVLSVNQALKHLRGEMILLLNNDTTITSDSIREAEETLSKEKVGAVGGRIIKIDGTLQEAGCSLFNNGGCYGYGVGEDPLDFRYQFEREVDFCSGAFLMTPRALFDSTGGFDENYSPAYYEEVDYCLRLKQSGYQVRYNPSCVIFHVEHGSSTRKEAVEAQKRNHTYFYEKNKAFLSTFPDQDQSIRMFGRVPSDTRIRILFIDDTIPFNERGSGAPRCKELLRNLSELKYDVTFYSMLLNNEVDSSEIRQHIPVNVECIADWGINKLHTFLLQRSGFYDVVFISRPHNMEHWKKAINKIPDFQVNAKLIYDAESIFAEREIRKIKTLGTMNISESEREYVIGKELELAKTADKIVVVSESDAMTFRNAGYLNVGVVSHGHEISPTETPFEVRSDILFVGPLSHENSPNLDGITWFIEEVLPVLRSKCSFNGKLSVVGNYKESNISHLRVPGVEFFGAQDTLVEFYSSHKMVIAPIRFAAGISLKVIEAASYGVPVVATNLIAELLSWEKQKDLLSANTAEEFAYACHILYHEKSLWTEIRESALQRVRQEYSPEVFKNSLKSLLES